MEGTPPFIPSSVPDNTAKSPISGLVAQPENDLIKLTSLTPRNAPNVRITREKQVWTFGRSPACDVVLPGRRISGVHFTLFEVIGLLVCVLIV
jgi:pSer/pThr/pTyr-binding forkhead associated (FHA) protein